MHRPLISLGQHENRVFHIFLCIKKHISHLCIWGALIHLLATRLVGEPATKLMHPKYENARCFLFIFFSHTMARPHRETKHRQATIAIFYTLCVAPV